MKVDYDFDEGVMSENLPKIIIPSLINHSDSLQSSRNALPMLIDIEKLML